MKHEQLLSEIVETLARYRETTDSDVFDQYAALKRKLCAAVPPREARTLLDAAAERAGWRNDPPAYFLGMRRGGE